MPIYEYGCVECGEEFEELQKVGATPPPCPSCTSENVSKKMSRTSFVLKGKGWYKDGYTGASNRAEKAASKTKETSGASSPSKESSSPSSTSSSSDSSSSSTKSDSTSPAKSSS